MKRGHQLLELSHSVSPMPGIANHSIPGRLFRWWRWMQPAILLLLAKGVVALASGPSPAGAAAMGLSSIMPLVQSSSDPIPFDQVATRLAGQYRGDELGIRATEQGAVLRCVFQKLNGLVAGDGLWIHSTVSNAPRGQFRVIADRIGRDRAPLQPIQGEGKVAVSSTEVHFERSRLTEVYAVSGDGIRQDFVLQQRPEGAGSAVIELEVQGAQAEPGPGGATLRLADGGRRLAYHRLRVSDAAGHPLEARMEVVASDRIRIVVEDVGAQYPVTVDPTFSDANWTGLNPSIAGVDDIVVVATVDSAGNLYLGGGFTFAGNTAAARIAKWDGSTWSGLGANMDLAVRSLLAVGTDLYAGGDFYVAGNQLVNHVAKWDGTQWSPLGSGMDGGVLSLSRIGSDIYVTGGFAHAGGQAARGIARWDGANWHPVGVGDEWYIVACAATVGNDVYVGGLKLDSDGNSYTALEKWNGSVWIPVSAAFDGEIQKLVSNGSDLFVTGQFLHVGEVAANHLAKWDGFTWSALGSGFSGFVSALVATPSEVYAVSGRFVGRWNGVTWTALGTGLGLYGSGVGSPGYGYGMAVSGSTVYVGGLFNSAGEMAAINVAKWDGAAWSAVSPGLSSPVNAVVVHGTDVYVGGSFMRTPGGAASRVAKWDGTTWSALGSGIGTGITEARSPFLTDSVNAMAMIGNDLYVAGFFRKAGGVDAVNIAKWDGTSWSALGDGVGDYATTLLAVGSDLYVGGWFSTAGGVSANRIAKWNGVSWSALSSGLTGGGPPYAMVAAGSDLYVGGWFTTAGGNPANYIAKWDGSVWSPLGSGMDRSVQALAYRNGELFAGGTMSTAGEVAVGRIAKWNGSTWTGLGSGVSSVLNPVFDANVNALRFVGTDLYVGGRFNTAGGISANGIAKWDGTSWSALGSGTVGAVNTIEVDAGGALVLGGTFTSAGPVASPYLARADLPIQITSFTPPANGLYGIGDSLTFSVGFPVEVTVTGAPQLSIQIGANARTATLIGGSGTGTLTFRYTIQSGDQDLDGIGLPSAVGLNGGLIRNANGKDVDLSFTAPDTSLVRVVNDHAPTGISLSSLTLNENQPIGSAIGILSAIDPDAGDGAAFSLVSGVGADDNGSFQIAGATLKSGVSFDFESKNSYSIRVRVTDDAGLFFERGFAVLIGNVNEPPTFTGYFVSTLKDTPVTVLLSKFLARSADPDGGTTSIASVDASTAQGGTAQLISSAILYTPPAGYAGSDSFGIVISDGVLTTPGTVQVVVKQETSGNGTALLGATATGADVNLRFAGIPGKSYLVQRSQSLTPPVTWTTIATVSANSSGFLIYTDSTPPSPSYWRTINAP